MNTKTRDGKYNTAASGKDQRLNLSPNIDDGDGFYDELLAAHEGMDEAASHAFNARLVLVLCNHIGERNTIREALIAAAGAGQATTVQS